MEHIYKKTLITYLLTILLLIGVIAGVLLVFQKIQLRIEAVRNVKERIASMEKYESIYIQEQQKFEAITNSLDTLRQEIVTERTIPLVLSNIELLAQESSIEAEIASAQIISPKGKPAYVSIDVKAKGSLEQLQQFMKKVEQSKSESSIEKFSLTQSVQGSEDAVPQSNIWELSVTIFVLSYI